MRIAKSFAVAASTLALATGAAFAGEGPLTDQSDPMGYQQDSDEQYAMQSPGYEVYDVYVVPVEEIVLIPLEQPSEVPISANELG